RLSTHLSEVLQPETNSLPGALVIVANELLPSQVALLGEREIAAIVTQSGGRTSHAAILARSHGIPAITGVHDILRQVRNGDLLVVDGRDGMVVINPDPETEAAYRKVQREFVHLKDALAANRDEPAVSKDGVAVELLANINNLDDLDTAKRMGAAGVGLYRTEYLFLSHPSVPNEQEQLDNYRQVFARAPGNNVAIRTLDLGGDKTVPYMGASREANPFLGWRSIRLSFEHPEFFARQIRAVLRAAADFDDGGIRLMFPMITTLEEMRRVTALVRRVRRRLDGEGVAYGKVEIGMMLEVPAAAVSIDNLLEVVDFVSIGSNDLVQYLMAADRDNPKVSHLCVPLSPPVLKTLRNVIARCNKHGKPVTLCGEMAGIPRAFLLLFGMGLRSYSMSPAFIPTIKDLLKHITVEEAEAILKQVLKLKTFAQVDRYMTAKLAEIAPNLKLLDTA
ncbi:MAG: phosphoenolpyruvate--protein phosphotransferase, partial [Pirellulales bacterium]